MLLPMATHVTERRDRPRRADVLAASGKSLAARTRCIQRPGNEAFYRPKARICTQVRGYYNKGPTATTITCKAIILDCRARDLIAHIAQSMALQVIIPRKIHVHRSNDHVAQH